MILVTVIDSGLVHPLRGFQPAASPTGDSCRADISGGVVSMVEVVNDIGNKEDSRPSLLLPEAFEQTTDR